MRLFYVQGTEKSRRVYPEISVDYTLFPTKKQEIQAPGPRPGWAGIPASHQSETAMYGTFGDFVAI